MKKLAFYFKIIARGGSELALLKYFMNNYNNDECVVIYYDAEQTDMSVVDDYNKYVETYHLKEGEIYNAKVAINCSMYDTDPEIFERIKAEKYVFWSNMSVFAVRIDYTGNALLKYDSYLATSKHIAKCIEQMNPNTKGRIFTANPIVNFEEIREKAKETQDEIIRTNGVYNLITVGRYTKDKGYEYNIEIARKLKELGVNFKWYSIGFLREKHRDFYNELQDRIKQYGLIDNVIHLGVKENPFKYISQCDLSLLFTTTEAWGLGITESKVLGVPVVASNVDGVPEQITNGENGLLYDLPKTEEDYLNIAKGIKNLLDNKEIYHSMQNKLQQFAYDVPGIVNTMNECFFNKKEL